MDPAFAAFLTRYREGLPLGSPQARSVFGVSRTGTTGSLEAWDQKSNEMCRNPELVNKKLRGVTSATTPVMGCEAEASVYLLRYQL